MRCFVAVDLPDEAKKEIQRVQQEMPEAKMKLIEKQNLHLTLEFLGELTDFQVSKCKEALKNIDVQKFKAFLGRVGVFPSGSYIRVVWISLEPNEIISSLHEKIHNCLKDFLHLDERFESHVTLSRIKFVQDKKEFVEKLENIKPRKIEFEVNDFSLKKSTLTKSGPIYEDIIRFSLY